LWTVVWLEALDPKALPDNWKRAAPAKNLGTADINYWVVEGNVGATEKFTRNGGAGIRARRIGSNP